MKVLGVMISNTLKWEENTDYITEKARKKIWILRGMKKIGLTISQLVDAYKKEVRSLLELAVPVWSQGITVDRSLKIERVQKAALSAITGDYNETYDVLREKYKLQRLSTRRDQICKKFIEKNMKSESPFFKVTEKSIILEASQI